MTLFSILREDLIRLIDSPDVSRRTKKPFVGFDVGKEIESDVLYVKSSLADTCREISSIIIAVQARRRVEKKNWGNRE